MTEEILSLIIKVQHILDNLPSDDDRKDFINLLCSKVCVKCGGKKDVMTTCYCDSAYDT